MNRPTNHRRKAPTKTTEPPNLKGTTPKRPHIKTDISKLGSVQCSLAGIFSGQGRLYV